MNSPFANIYLALQEQITAQVPAIVYIDMDYGQLDMKDRPAVAFPAVLVDFQSWQFSEAANLVQNASGSVVLKLATNPYSSSSNITPETYKEDAISLLDLEYSLYKALQGWKPIAGTPMIRTSYQSDNRRPGLKVRVMTFTLSFQDYSAKRTYATVAAQPAITAQIELPGQ